MALRLKDRVKQWYRGKYIPPPPNDPGSPVVFVSLGHYEQPILAKILRFLAKILRSLGKFWMKNWKWIMGTAIALFALIWTIIHTE